MKSIDELRGDIENRISLIRTISANREYIGRLERILDRREKDGVDYDYDELRMRFTSEEIRALIRYKKDIINKAQDELEYIKKEDERSKIKKELTKCQKIKEELDYNVLKDVLHELHSIHRDNEAYIATLVECRIKELKEKLYEL